jgi:hypothetical protein
MKIYEHSCATCLVLFPQRHDRAHVDLVEGGQHGVGVLRLLQPLRNLETHPVHLDLGPML